MTALAEGQGDMLWTVVYAITPNVNVTSKAAIAAGISHGNDGLELIEGMKVVTSTRERESRPLIVFIVRAGEDFHLWNNPMRARHSNKNHGLIVR